MYSVRVRALQENLQAEKIILNYCSFVPSLLFFLVLSFSYFHINCEISLLLFALFGLVLSFYFVFNLRNDRAHLFFLKFTLRTEMDIYLLFLASYKLND